MKQPQAIEDIERFLRKLGVPEDQIECHLFHVKAARTPQKPKKEGRRKPTTAGAMRRVG